MITGAEYKAISDSIHEMQDSLANVESVSIDMQATVNALSLAYIGANPLLNFNNTSNEIDYFEDINNTLRGFEDSGSNFQSSNQLNDFVVALQLFVLESHDTIDDFLQTEGILVKQKFADLSDQLGYTISSLYIEP